MRIKSFFLRGIGILVVSLAGCSPAGNPLPPVEQFQTPAAGMPVPADQQAAQIALPLGSSGVLFVNQTNTPVQVVVSGTLAVIPAAQGFLFVLPSGAHDFYIYEPNAAPRVHSERTEADKVRYVYLLPLGR